MTNIYVYTKKSRFGLKMRSDFFRVTSKY